MQLAPPSVFPGLLLLACNYVIQEETIVMGALCFSCPRGRWEGFLPLLEI